MNYVNESSDDPTTIANFFADFFEKVYTPPLNRNIDHLFTCNCVDHFSITEDEIRLAILSFDKNKSNSPDSIPIIFYTESTPEILNPLRIIFNQSLETKTFPTKWKYSLIVPLFKNGNKASVTNYRPISILSACSKLFEKVMYFHLNRKYGDLICHQQHGFRVGKSTLTNLIEYTDFLTKNTVKGGQVDTVYTDFAKAFDTVGHKILIERLHNMNINPCILAWIYSYITKRTQVVCINGVNSKIIHPTSSVVQGSILSPLFFALFINDLPLLLNSKCLLFADDCKIFRKIDSIQDCIFLQNDLNLIAQWCNETGIRINESKCTILSTTRKTEDRTISYNYRINNIFIERSGLVKDLGVLFDTKMSFEAHINSISSRAYKSMGFITRSLNDFNSMETYKILYNTYVRSILEYNSQIWYPYYDKYIVQLEKVQNKFTRHLSYKFNFPRATPKDRLESAKMESLMFRRILADEILLYKLVCGNTITSLSNGINIHIPTRLTRFSPAFYLPNSNTNIESYCVINRIQRHHNKFFFNVNTLNQSISSFKSQIVNSLHNYGNSRNNCMKFELFS